jgi:hypothetical protein
MPSSSLFVQVHCDLQQHPRFADLLAQLDPGVDEDLVYADLVLLWSAAMERQPDGDLTEWSAAAIARASHWRGDRDQWLEALLGAGFLERVEDRLMIHNWPVYSGKLWINRAKDAARKATSRSGNEVDVPVTSNGQATDVHRMSAGHPPEVRVTSSRVKSRDLKTRDEDVVLNTPVNPATPDLRREQSRANARVHARIHARAETSNGLPGHDPDEDDEFLKTLNEPPPPESDSGGGRPGYEPDDVKRGEVVRLADFPSKERKQRPASADEILEIRRHWEKAFLGIGAQGRYQLSLQKASEHMGFASAERLNRWFHEDFDRAQALQPAEDARSGVSAAEMRQFEGIEIKAVAWAT